jgi:hypothetical protein
VDIGTLANSMRGGIPRLPIKQKFNLSPGVERTI